MLKMFKNNLIANLNRRLFQNERFSYRMVSSQVKPVITLNENVEKDLENEKYKPRRHPGTVQNKAISMPEPILEALQRVIIDYPTKSLIRDGQKLSRYLKARHIPLETTDIPKQKDNGSSKPIYNWKAINYDKYKAYCYLIGRSVPEYAIILKIFHEISERNADFKPRSFFDFGSGTGTGLWSAITQWPNLIYEHYLVDISREMNDLSEKILQEAHWKNVDLRTVFHRQFLPAATTEYDIVLSAYSLFELPDAKTRAEVVLNLWTRCSGYLILIENGTRAGFKLITEARDLILKTNSTNNEVHSFSPCPHDSACPRVTADDGTPCNFVSTYFPLPFDSNSTVRHELYSYIVMRKNGRDPNDKNENWPRLVRPTLVRKRHSICRMCTRNGELQEAIFTPSKHSQSLYRCARSSDWGDRLPISIDKK